jgi:sterol desaturase/sphingolipid hydroxylase (fatty acid hydroxylase superfamily)
MTTDAAQTSWILRVSESKVNYWATYVVDTALMIFFVAWDAERLNLSALGIVVLFVLGVAAWTLTEYVFHRWVYHFGFAIARAGHEKHHEEPTAYLAMPAFVTPLLFLPPQLIAAGYYKAHGVSSLLGGFFFGYIAYSFMHHSLHHYKLRYAWFRHLQSAHRIHHALPETNYGVTMRFWDRVFGTEFRKPKRDESDAAAA